NVFTVLIFLGRNMMIVVIAATSMSSENRIMNAPTINKIEFVCRAARFGFLLALGVLTLTALFTTAAPVKTDEHSNPHAVVADTARRYWNGSQILQKPPMSRCRFAQAHLSWQKPDC